MKKLMMESRQSYKVQDLNRLFKFMFMLFGVELNLIEPDTCNY